MGLPFIGDADEHSRTSQHCQQACSGFDRLPIAGEWRRVKMRSLKNIDPFTGDVMLEIPQANRSDLDDGVDLPTAPGATQTKTARFCRAVLLFRSRCRYSPLPKRRDHHPARRGWPSSAASGPGAGCGGAGATDGCGGL